MTRIWAIASNTFREAIRDRILYLLLVFALLFMGFSQVLSLLTVGGEEKIIKDVGLASISLFGVLTSVFIGVALVSKEIEINNFEVPDVRLSDHRSVLCDFTVKRAVAS